MAAQVKIHHGTPTAFLEGTAKFYSLMWGSAPEPDDYALKTCTSLFAQAGVHLFTFDIGTGGTPPEWCGPQPGVEGHFNFASFKTRLQRVIQADPQARFHLRVHLEMPTWWQELYPEECELVSDGRRLCQSYASPTWRRQAKAFLQALVKQVEQDGLADRVVAYQCGTGSSGEWVKGPSAMGQVCGDYSLPMLTHFRSWLSERYANHVTGLQQAWGMPAVTFETAVVPTAGAQFNTTRGTFRDPAHEQQAVDYFKCLADLSAELLIDFCQTVKEASGGKALAGAFYGYLLELAWNAGFFGEGVDSEYSTYQRSGHLGLQKVLESPSIDFLVSPYSYGFRGPGGDGSAMPPSESLRIHGKLYIFEDDSRTHLSTHDHANYGQAETLEESTALLKRNLAYVLTHGHGIWWLAGSPNYPHVDLSVEPAFQPLIRRFEDLGAFVLHLDRSPSAEVAVLLDDESFYYEWLKNSLDLPLIFQQRLWGLAHMGAPFDVYLLDDFLNGRMKPYKLYIFLNAFHLDSQRRQALKGQIRREGRTALWIYAPGYLDQEGSTAHMTELTGIHFESGEHPWGPLISLSRFNHPITQGLTADVTWGTNTPLGPVFHVADSQAETLGTVVYSRGRCRPGFVVKEFTEWKSVYSAAPNLPASVLRGIARYAGVHIYTSDGDTLYAARELVCIHSASGGQREVRLPVRVERVVELFSGQEIARDTDRFTVSLPPVSTMLYFTGLEKLLSELQHPQT